MFALNMQSLIINENILQEQILIARDQNTHIYATEGAGITLLCKRFIKEGARNLPPIFMLQRASASLCRY